MKDYIEQERNRIKKTYIDNPKTMILQYGIEVEKTQEYNGRQILELLQNADDEAEYASQKTILISVNEERLLIANNGDAFTEEGVDSLLYSHSSSKVRKKNKIGHKGTGFRSILSWADVVHIKSHHLSIEFSRQHAIRLLNEIIIENPGIKEIISKQKDDYPIATLVAPKWQDSVSFSNVTNEHFDTYIALSLKQGVYRDIVRQLEDLDLEDILFMQNTERLIIETKEKKISFSIECLKEKQVIINQEGLEISNETVKVTMLENDIEERSKVWTVNGTKGIHEDKEFEIKVAFTNDFDDDKDVLYSFFRTNVQLPFPALIHGTFELNGNRNQINISLNNRFLMEKLIDVLIETAKMITKDSEKVSWDSLRLLSFDGQYDKNLESMGFKTQLIRRIKKSNLFPTKSGAYISYDDKPLFYQDVEAQYLPVEFYPKLTIHTKDRILVKLLTEIGIYKYSYSYLCSQLSKASNSLTSDTRAHIVKFLLQSYVEDIKRERPSIFIDEDDQLISDGNEIFLPLNDRNIKVPDFVSLRFMNKSLYQSLLKVYHPSDTKLLWNQLRLFNIQEYKTETVIKKIVAQTTAIIDGIHKHKGKYVKQLMQCLLDIYITAKRSGDNFPHGVVVPTLNRHNQVMTTAELYFGKEFRESVTENLFKPFRKNCFIGSAKILGLSKIDKEEVKNFLSWIGIKAYPRLFITKINNKEYEQRIYEGMSGAFPLKLPNLPRTIVSLNDMFQYQSAGSQISVETVDALDLILANSSFEDIIIWLIKCKPLYDIVAAGVEQNAYSAFSMRFKYRQESTKLPKEYLKSYILWRLQKDNWVRNQQKEKLNPQNFCFTRAIQHDLTPFIQIPDIDLNHESFRNAKITHDDVAKLFINIGIGANMVNFSTEIIYSILNGLSESDADGRKAKTIYKLLIESKPKINKEAECYKNFINHGKVLAQKGYELQYETVSNVYYLPHPMYCKDILKNFHVLTIEKSIAKSRVRETLGIHPFEGVKYNLMSRPEFHDLHDDFQLEFEELKPYFYMDLLSKDSSHKILDSLKQIKVSLCNDIEASYNFKKTETDFTIQEYEMIVIDNTIFIKLEQGNHNTIDDLRHDNTFSNLFTGAVSELLREEDSRSFFKGIYVVRRVDRDDQIVQQFEDEELLLLSQAKQLMGGAANPCKDFWLSVIRTKKIKNHEDMPIDDEEFKEFILRVLKIDRGEFLEIYGSLNYEDINTFMNISCLRKLFHLMSMKIERFNANTLNKIDLSDYMNREYSRLNVEYKYLYYSQLYVRLANASVPEMQQFVRKQLQYENFNDYPFTNSFEFNIVSHFKQTMDEKFGFNLEEKGQFIELSTIYSNHLTMFENMINVNFNVRRDEVDAFLVKSEYKSLIFFNQLPYLYEHFEKTHRDKLRIRFTDSTNGGLGTKEGNSENHFQAMFDDISRRFIQNPIGIKDINSKRPSEKPNKKPDPKVRTGTGVSVGRLNEDIGYQGEVFAYFALCSAHGAENVEWVSENAYRARVNASGTNSLHFDLKYKDKEGNYHFVEVKTSVNDLAVFNISKEEVTFGETNKDFYEILIVLNVNNEPDIWRLNSVFKYKKAESFRYNDRFKVENSVFKIRFVPQ